MIAFAGYKVYSVYYPQLIVEIKNQAQKKFDIELDFTNLQISSLNPIGLKVNNLTAKKKNLFQIETQSIEVKVLNLQSLLQQKTKKPEIDFTVTDFKIELLANNKITPPETSAANTSSPLPFNSLEKALPENPYINNLKINFSLINGLVVGKKNSERIIDLNTKLLTVAINDLKEPLKFDFDGEVKSMVDNFALSYPISIGSLLQYSNGWIEAKNTDFNFIGIENKLNFKLHPTSKYIDLTSEVDVPNLNKLPIGLIENFPLSKLLGSLKSKFKVTGYLEKNPLISGDVDLKIFSADLSLKQKDIASSGNFNLNLKTKFDFKEKLTIHSIKWAADLSKAYFEKTDFFKKPVGIPFVTEGSGAFKDDFNLEKFKLHFDQIRAEAQGLLSLDKVSQFSFDIPEFDFKGFEKYLLFIPQYPISGKFAAKGEVQGLLKDPTNLNLNLSQVKLTQLKYTLYKKINDVEIEGPVQADFQGALHVNKQVAIKGDLKGHIDADSLNIKKNGDVLKVGDDPLKVEFKTNVVNQKIQIENFDIKSMFGWMQISGKPPIGFNDPINLNIKVNKINWIRIRNFLPKNEVINNIKNITASGNLNVTGSINEKDLLSSPLMITGSSQVGISEVLIPWELALSTGTEDKAKEAEAKLITPEPFVPQKDLLAKIKVSNVLSIDKVLLKDKSAFEGLQFTTKIENNNLLFNGSIKKIFNGDLKVKSVILPLTSIDPVIHYDVASQGIDLAAMLRIFLPTYKDLIKGQASLQVEGNSHLPYSVNFKKNLQAKGQFSYADGKLNALDMAKLVKEKLMLLPGISLPKKIDNTQIEGAIKSNFELKNLSVTVTDFSAKSKKNEELQINGSINTELEADLKAQLLLVDLPLKGDFINANKDPQGRVGFPIEIKGKLTEPKWNFVGNSLEAMTSKYMNNEKQKVINLASKEVEKKKNEAQRAVQSEVNKQKSKLENEAKKAFDGLFK